MPSDDKTPTDDTTSSEVQQNLLDVAKEKAASHWIGDKPKTINGMTEEVRSVKEMHGEELQQVLNGLRAFQIVVSNPVSQIAGRPYFEYTILLQGDEVHYLDNYEQVAAFLSATKRASISDRVSAEGFLTAFAQLSNLQIPTAQQRKIATPGGSGGFTAQDWETKIEQGPKGWVIEAAFLADENSYRFVRLTFAFGQAGVEVKMSKQFAMRGYS